jgi:hypothetical protein
MALYSKHVPRDLGKALNWKALVITKETQKGTPLAERARIEYQMGVGGYQLKQVKQGKNKGKLRKTNAPIWFPHPRALSIVLGRMKAKGHTAISFQDAMEKARKLVMAKIRAIGSAKAGWNKPLRQLAAAVKGQAFNPASRTRVKLEGYGRGANRDQWKKVVEVSYDVLDKGQGHQIGAGTMGAAYPKVEAALKKSMSAEAKRTIEFIAQTIKRNPLFIKNYR